MVKWLMVKWLMVKWIIDEGLWIRGLGDFNA